MTRNEAIVANYPLMVFLARRFARPGMDPRDITQETAVLMLTGSLDPDRPGIEVRAYISLLTRTAARLLADKARRRERELAAAARRHNQNRPAGAELPEPDRQVVLAAVAGLRAQTRAIIECRYGLGGHDQLTRHEVASGLGVSTARIKDIELNALRMLGTGLRDGFAV